MRRSAAAVDRSMRARLLTTLSMLGPPLLQPAQCAALLPQSLTVAVSVVGLAIVIAGKMTLGRSFGLMPANRGIVSSGLYRVVRHPIYLGYLITHVAFLVATPSAWNIAALVVGRRRAAGARRLRGADARRGTTQYRDLSAGACAGECVRACSKRGI